MFDRDPLIDRPQLLGGDSTFMQSGGKCKTKVSFGFQVTGSSSAPNVSINDVGESLNQADELYDHLERVLQHDGAFNSISGVEIQTGGSFGTIDIATTSMVNMDIIEGDRDRAFREVEGYLDDEWMGDFNMQVFSEADRPAIFVEPTTRSLPRF
jgi:hypothetical protein